MNREKKLRAVVTQFGVSFVLRKNKRQTILAIPFLFCYNSSTKGRIEYNSGKGVYMTKRQFMEQVTGKLKELHSESDYEISCDVFTKNNDTPRYGIVIQKVGEAISPTIYVDNYFKDYVDKKMTLTEVAEQIIAVLQNVRKHASKYESFSVEYDSCKPNIVYRLISFEKNKRLLQEVPYIPFLNLAVTFSIVCSLSEQGLESLRITNDLKDKWQVTTGELVRLAEENTPRLFPPQVDSMENVLFTYLGLEKGMFPENTEYGPLLIVTNESGVNGASVLLYQDVIHDIAEKYGKNLYVLPSSVHEIIVVPNENSGSLKELSKMVKDINKKHVSEEEILSDNAYYYDREKRKFLY